MVIVVKILCFIHVHANLPKKTPPKTKLKLVDWILLSKVLAFFYTLGML